MCVHESWWQGQLRLSGGRGGSRDGGGAISSLFGHPLRFIFVNPKHPQNLKIKKFEQYRNHPRGQKTLFTRDDIRKVQQVDEFLLD